MPADPTLWIVFLALSALVLGLAIWLGRGLRVRKTKEEFSLEVKERAIESHTAEGPAKSAVTIAKGLEGESLTVGNVTGVESKGGPTPDVDVLSGAKLKNARIGDITGVRQDGSASKDKE
jgi:hypothetical protein